MKTVLTTLNAKYIHTSLALRWLYVANKDKFDISFREYTIKEHIEVIAGELLASGCHILGLSVSIWNVDQSRHLCALLKQSKPEMIIIVGGPEVMHEPEYFIRNWPINYVISGDGEFVLGKLLHALQHNIEPDIPGVSTHQKISKHVTQADLAVLATLCSPYTLEQDKEEMKNKLVYFETSRGCPYQCQYCLSSLEKGVRYFPQQYVLQSLKSLMDSDIKQIKFLDRTFNLNKEHTLAIFDFLIANYRPNLSCQFEIYADLLDDEIITYLNTNLPPHYFRFEIGVQSTHEPTNVAVKRKQNLELLRANVQKLMDGKKIDLHLDLIAGLPHETYERFIKSFDDVFVLRAKEVQLGFLKMLRGTPLRHNADLYGYQYEPNAPYTIVCNAHISQDQLTRIHNAEHALEKYWNSGRFARTMNHLFDTHYKGQYYALFDDIAQHHQMQQYPHHGYQLEDLFRFFHSFLQWRGIDLFELLRTDYYHNFARRPHGFWPNETDKKTKRSWYYNIGQDKPFLSKHNLSRRIIEKQAAIDPLSHNELLITIFPAEGEGGEIVSLKYKIQ